MSNLALIALASFIIGPTTKTYDVNGVQRTANIVAPSVKTEHPPVVFSFHGHGGNARLTQRSFQIESEWPEAVVIYMQGLPTKGKTDPEGKKNGWQQTAGQDGGRDLAYFDTVWKDIQATYRPDLKRVYSMGHSNGGRFTYVLWAERADVFAAFAPSGSPATIDRLAPRPLFHIAGENDPIVPFKGQMLSVNRIMKIDGCSGEGKKISENATLYEGQNNNDVVTYYHPGGHNYPKDAPKMIVEFFKAHPKK